MANQFTKGDREFLKQVKVADAEPPDYRLALAQRIAKHQAPVQVVVDPDRARLALIRLAVEKLLDALGQRDPQALEKLINALEGRVEQT